MFDPLALSQSPIPHFVLDEEHRIILWNRACELLTGLGAEATLGTTNQWQPFFPEPSATLADLVLDHAAAMPRTDGFGNGITRRARDKGVWECWLHLTTAGNERYLHCTARLLRDDGGPVRGVVQALYDQTEQRLREIELSHSQRDYATIAEAFPEGFLVLQRNHLVIVNKIFANFLGYQAPEQIIGRLGSDFIAESHRQAFLRNLDDLDADRKPLCKAQWPHLRQNGEIIWLEGHPRRILWRGEPAALSILVDITERRQRQEPSLLSEIPVEDRYRLGRIVGKSPGIRQVYSRVLKAAAQQVSVLVTGESGTGKEVVARTIHELSPRADKPFVAVNCGAIPSELMESMFFGYRKGAFTGAYADRTGFLDQADGGSLFLDEVGDLPLGMQVKLLRFLDNHGFTPLGASELRNADVRIIAATNRNLKELMQTGRIREDFYYRLYIIPIHLPPLRERKEDISLLVDEYFSRSAPPATARLPGYILDALLEYDWPGNVRELQNTLQRFLTLGSLDMVAERSDRPRSSPLGGDGTRSLSELRSDLDRRVLEQALQRTGGNRNQAAALLGISRRTLYRKLRGARSDT